ATLAAWNSATGVPWSSRRALGCGFAAPNRASMRPVCCRRLRTPPPGWPPSTSSAPAWRRSSSASPAGATSPRARAARRTSERRCQVSLRHSVAIARQDARVFRRDPLFVVVFTVMPLIVMAFVKPAFRDTLVAHGAAGANGAEQAVPGLAVMFSFFLVGQAGWGVFREHGWNTWLRLRASWASTPDIVAGK